LEKAELDLDLHVFTLCLFAWVLFGWPCTRAQPLVYKTARNHADCPGAHHKLPRLVCAYCSVHSDHMQCVYLTLFNRIKMSEKCEFTSFLVIWMQIQ